MLIEKIYRVIVKDDFGPLEVNYDVPLDQLLIKSAARTSSGFDEKVASLNPEPKKMGTERLRVAQVMFYTKPGEMVTTHEVNQWAQENKVREANIKELVCFLTRFRAVTGGSREMMIALGSSVGKKEPWHQFFPHYGLSELSTDKGFVGFVGCREFTLNGWDYHHQFLMVKAG